MELLSDDEWQERQRQFQSWLSETVGFTAEMTTTLKDKDDDWTFVIKIHAMIEVALNHMVTGRMYHPELNEIIPRLPVHGRTGKVEFASAFKLLPETSLGFIDRMSELRRHLVHDIKHFDFNLTDYFLKMDKTKLEAWKSALTFNLGDSVTDDLRIFAVVCPRFSMFEACMSIMSFSFDAQPRQVRAVDLYYEAMRRAAEKRGESNPKE